MKAFEIKLQGLMNTAIQFVVPIYQRKYSWTQKQCDKLWEDIIEVSTKEAEEVHFIGSVVYIDQGIPVGKPRQLLLIDGQQRLATLSLLLCALTRYIDESKQNHELSASKVRNYFLLNNEEVGPDRFKLVLSQQDEKTLTALIESDEASLSEPSQLMIANFNNFMKLIKSSKLKIKDIYNGIDKLMLVSVALDKNQDNPQLIFESMNSTGKDLTQADLIRNYILMGLCPQEQKELYDKYWRPMELGFGQKGYAEDFDNFMRHFLTSQDGSGKICKLREIYDTFKAVHKTGSSNEEVLKKIYKYSNYYVAMYLEKEKEKALLPLWKEINTLEVSVSYPFLMNVYNDYKNKKISLDDFIVIIEYVINYVVRRVLCETPRNSLNSTFATLYVKVGLGTIEKDNYVKAIIYELLSLETYKSFPSDEEVKSKLVYRNIYNLKIRNYLLEKLENYDHKEKISIIDCAFTIEHIMPQNKELSSEWVEMIGEDWKNIQKTYLHTIGNLTLTKYNSEMSDKSFEHKKTIKGGFKDSHLRLNNEIANVSKWTKDEILARTNSLGERMLLIWPYPKLTQQETSYFFEKFEVSKKNKKYSSMNHYTQMTPEIRDVFDELDRKILSLDSQIRKEYNKHYLSYKLERNFVDIEPHKNLFKLLINMTFEDIEDKNKLCRNVRDIGHLGNGDVEITIKDDTRTKEAFEIVLQSFNYHARQIKDCMQ